MSDASLNAEYFEEMYAGNPDPWNFATSRYEADKYADTIEKLAGARYKRGFEIGCSIGVLTSLLADRCDELVAVDINERALTEAVKRCRTKPNVKFQLMNVPKDMPAGDFDFVMVSEVGYYWSDDDLDLAKTRIAQLGQGTTVELVHFIPKVSDYKRDGDAVHAAFRIDRRFEIIRSSRADRYRIDVLRVR